MTTLERPSVQGHDKRVTHMRGFLVGSGFHRAAEAMSFAAGHHTGLRKDGVTPAMAHQIYIASYVATLLPHLRYPEETLAAAFLHDVVEDYDVPVATIATHFGSVVADAVDALSKIVSGVKRSPESVAQMQASDPIASIVKAADRINNQQTMPGVFSVDKMRAYIDETKRYILPMVKTARSNFPSQSLAYENAKTVLWAQIELLEAAAAGLC